ncbi:unnamed protein product [Tuber melanosporum]|uniref:(Perigord truffle) hypothetical protein n=1 Tax=Tuber melanosporum (strain Mel28) TaxID=656061 RepID=D5G5S8_TUBMM|nr:uncharacterized protein GSTUM_00001463001 [Tuber melanosporum]CAZ79871.1 unnamed protein product [Tuber melanosporum]
MFPTRALLTQKVYKAKKPWPPDFSLLSQKHQFRLERRYRRRMKLKFARPRLHKAVNLAQGVIISAVLLWGVFINDWGERGNRPVQPIRNWVSDLRKSFWSTPSRPEVSKQPRTPSSSGSISEASGR